MFVRDFTLLKIIILLFGAVKQYVPFFSLTAKSS